MVQEFHVIRCATCENFQVQQVKKVKRWSCKVCGEKQSLLKEYGRGSGADCRRDVQKLNALRGAAIEEQNTWEPEEDREDTYKCPQDRQTAERERQDGERQEKAREQSRWSKYLDTSEEAELREEPDSQQLNNQTDRKRKTRDSPEQGHSHSKTAARTSGLIQSTTRATGLIQSTTRTTGLSQSTTRPTGLSRSTPPTEELIQHSSGISGLDSKWTHFLRSDHGETPPISGRSEQMGRPTTPLSCGDIIGRHAGPASSLFETEEDFSLDEEDQDWVTLDLSVKRK